MSKEIRVGTVDYDYDKYGNRIRKFVLDHYTRERGKRVPVWKQDENFKAETGFENIKREVK